MISDRTIVKIAILLWCIYKGDSVSSQSKYGLNEQLTHTTIPIICITKDSVFKGSGFFFSFNRDSTKHNYIVTNKHVIKSPSKGILLFNRIRLGEVSYGEVVQVTLDGFDKRWISHPDASVDLCILPIDDLMRYYSRRGIELAVTVIPEDLIPPDSLWSAFSVLEDVTMIGYPNGLIDSVNHTPVVRTGVTATLPKLNYQGTPSFLIDIAAFPGSSGSPVFLKKTKYGFDKNYPGLSVGKSDQYFFVGVLYAGPMYKANEKRFVFQKIGDVERDSLAPSIFEVPMNLGRVIRSSELYRFKEILLSDH